MAIYTTDFSDQPLGSPPANFTHAASETYYLPDVIADTSATGGRVFRAQAITANITGRYARFNPSSADPNKVDTEILTLLKVVSSFRLEINSRYRLAVSGTTCSINNGTTALQSVNSTFLDNTWYWFRFRMQGENLKAKFWLKGEAEPAWQIETTNAVNTTPTDTEFTWYFARDVHVDYFALATNGDTVPLPTIRRVIVDTDATQNPDYTTLAAAFEGEKLVNADLITANEILIIECRATTGVIDTSAFNPSGYTCDNLRYVQIEAGAGHEFTGVYDANRYVLERPISTTFQISQRSLRFKGLQIIRTDVNVSNLTMVGIAAGYPVIVDSCYLDGGPFTIGGNSTGVIMGGWNTSQDVIVRNSVFYRCTDSYKTEFLVCQGGTWIAENCTFYAPSGSLLTNKPNGILYIRNCVGIRGAGVVEPFSGTSVGSYNNIGNGPATIGENSISNVSRAEVFLDHTTGDLRPPLTSPTINAGATLTSFNVDLLGRTRPYGSSWDIGAFEVQTNVFPTDCNRKAAITIQASQVPSLLSDFPLLLTKDTLPSEMFDADGLYPAQNGGGDIRFSLDPEGLNQLPCEIVSFITNNNPTLGSAEIWVKVPSVSASVNTIIYIWYNTSDTDLQPAVGDTYGRNAVWADYEAVHHFQNGDGSDSTGSAHNFNSVQSGTPGTLSGIFPFGTGIALNNTLVLDNTQYTSTTFDKTQTWSVSMWGVSGSTHTDVQLFWHPRSIREITVELDYDDNLRFAFTEGSTYFLPFPNAAFTINTPRFISLSSDGISILNLKTESNAPINQFASYGNPGFFDNVPLDPESNQIGGVEWGAGDQRFLQSGGISELRVASVYRSSEWYDAEYANQSDPITFAVAGQPRDLVASVIGGFNFRGTGSYVIDGPNEVPILGEQYPHEVSINGRVFNVGWSGSLNLSADRAASFDRRLAGVNQLNAGTVRSFRVDLPGPGIYRIGTAMGDAQFAVTGTHNLRLYDGETLKATLNNNVTLSLYRGMYDAVGTLLDITEWPAQHTLVEYEFTQSYLRFELDSTTQARITHVYIELVSLNPLTTIIDVTDGIGRTFALGQTGIITTGFNFGAAPV